MTLRIPPSGSNHLELADAGDYAWLATLELDGLRAEAYVENGPTNLTGLTIADLLAHMAEHWRGWQGARVWANNEQTLQLSATHDGTGHVALTVLLRRLSDPEWEITAALGLEAGMLAIVARGAAAFDREQGSRDGRAEDRIVRDEYLRPPLDSG